MSRYDFFFLTFGTGGTLSCSWMFPVHLVIIGNLRVGHVEDPGVSDGHPVGIAANVFEDLSNAFGWRTRIDDPCFCKALFAYSLIYDDAILLEPPGK